MALVLLKRNAETLWDQVGSNGQEEVKERLLALLTLQLPSRVLSTLTNTIAAVALTVSDKGGGSPDEPLNLFFCHLRDVELLRLSLK
jgi:hypothetical protein